MKEARHKRPHIVWFHLYEISRTNKSKETESRFVVAWDHLLWGAGNKDWLPKEYEVSFYALELYSGDGYTMH